MLVGRTEELARARAWLAGAARAPGERALWVWGVQGSGRSALIRRALHEAAVSWFAHVHCAAADVGLPGVGVKRVIAALQEAVGGATPVEPAPAAAWAQLCAVRDLLERSAPEKGLDDDIAEEWLAVFREVVEATTWASHGRAASLQGLVLVLEDVEAMDPWSAAWCRRALCGAGEAVGPLIGAVVCSAVQRPAAPWTARVGDVAALEVTSLSMPEARTLFERAAARGGFFHPTLADRFAACIAVDRTPFGLEWLARAVQEGAAEALVADGHDALSLERVVLTRSWRALPADAQRLVAAVWLGGDTSVPVTEQHAVPLAHLAAAPVAVNTDDPTWPEQLLQAMQATSVAMLPAVQRASSAGWVRLTASGRLVMAQERLSTFVASLADEVVVETAAAVVPLIDAVLVARGITASSEFLARAVLVATVAAPRVPSAPMPTLALAALYLALRCLRLGLDADAEQHARVPASMPRAVQWRVWAGVVHVVLALQPDLQMLRLFQRWLDEVDRSPAPWTEDEVALRAVLIAQVAGVQVQADERRGAIKAVGRALSGPPLPSDLQEILVTSVHIHLGEYSLGHEAREEWARVEAHIASHPAGPPTAVLLGTRFAFETEERARWWTARRRLTDAISRSSSLVPAADGVSDISLALVLARCAEELAVAMPLRGHPETFSLGARLLMNMQAACRLMGVEGAATINDVLVQHAQEWSSLGIQERAEYMRCVSAMSWVIRPAEALAMDRTYRDRVARYAAIQPRYDSCLLQQWLAAVVSGADEPRRWILSQLQDTPGRSSDRPLAILLAVLLIEQAAGRFPLVADVTVTRLLATVERLAGGLAPDSLLEYVLLVRKTADSAGRAAIDTLVKESLAHRREPCPFRPGFNATGRLVYGDVQWRDISAGPIARARVAYAANQAILQEGRVMETLRAEVARIVGVDALVNYMPSDTPFDALVARAEGETVRLIETGAPTWRALLG